MSVQDSLDRAGLGIYAPRLDELSCATVHQLAAVEGNARAALLDLLRAVFFPLQSSGIVEHGQALYRHARRGQFQAVATLVLYALQVTFQCPQAIYISPRRWRARGCRG